MNIPLCPSSRDRTPGTRSTACIPFALLLIAGVVATPALARALDLDRAISFDIPAQPLESALIDFSKQSHIQVVIGQDGAGEAAAPAIRATLSARVALNTLIGNSGFKYVAIGDSVSVTRVAARPESTLGPETQGSNSPGAVSGSPDQRTGTMQSADRQT